MNTIEHYGNRGEWVSGVVMTTGAPAVFKTFQIERTRLNVHKEMFLEPVTCQRLRDCQITLNLSNFCLCAFTHQFNQRRRAISLPRILLIWIYDMFILDYHS